MLFALGLLLAAAVAQSWEADDRAQEAPTTARIALEGMSLTERKNALISLEFENNDSAAVALGCEVEQLWNDGQYDEALAQFGELEARVGHVAIGNSWRRPVPTVETQLWGRDVRIGNRDSILSLALVRHTSGNLFAALRRGRIPHFSLCMSTDGGTTWDETFTWSGSAPTSIDAGVATRYIYVVYNSPGEDAQQVRLRRFLWSDGRAAAFGNGGAWVAPCTLGVGDSMREAAFATNQDNNQLFLVTLVSDGSVLLSLDRADAMSWTRQPTGITAGARSGLDATDDQRSDTTHLFFSYCDSSDTVRVCDAAGQRLARPAGSGTLTSISAYCDTVFCAYEDGTSSLHRVRYAGSFDGGDTWTVDMASDSGIAANTPAITVYNGGLAAVYRCSTSTPELRFCRPGYDGLWGDPVLIAEHEPCPSRPGIIYVGAGVYGVAYLSDTSPVVRGAYFDRSDWVYGIAEESRPQVSSHKPRATVVRGVLFLQEGSSLKPQAARLIYASGRTARELHAGANDLRSLAPGVYFVREAVSGQRSAVGVRKVVVTR